MAFNDSFGNFGHFAFSSKPTHGRTIYLALIDGQGESYNRDFTSVQSARLYAASMCLAQAYYQLERAGNNRYPGTATELLGQLERDYQVTPPQNATLKQRRDYLAALFLISQGNKRSAIEAALSKLFGSDFVAYQTTPPGTGLTWPASPGSVGTFTPPNTPIKQFQIHQAISITGAIVDFNFTATDGSDGPLANESYTVDPDPRRSTEKITIVSVNGNTASAVFSHAHDPGTMATRPYPVWISSQRYSRIILTLSAAQDPEKRRVANELMARAARGVSQWGVASDQGTLSLNDPARGLIGCTQLG